MATIMQGNESFKVLPGKIREIKGYLGVLAKMEHSTDKTLNEKDDR